jgi:hypothetical protein
MTTRSKVRSDIGRPGEASPQTIGHDIHPGTDRFRTSGNKLAIDNDDTFLADAHQAEGAARGARSRAAPEREDAGRPEGDDEALPFEPFQGPAVDTERNRPRSDSGIAGPTSECRGRGGVH